VTVEQLDPRTAAAADIAAFHAAKLAATALDRPEMPAQSASDFRAWLGAESPAHRMVFRLARSGGTAVGFSCLMLPLKRNLRTGLLWTWVHPDRRRGGVGTELLADAVDLIRADGRQLIIGETIEGTAGAAFGERYGFRRAQREVLSRLDLSTVDREFLAVTVRTPHPPYRLEHWRGPVPEEWLERYARALGGMLDAPRGELRYEPPNYAPEHVRSEETWIAGRGREQHITVAIHEPTGEVAGLTVLLVPTEPDGWAYQDDTTVVREHRGHGLGLWVKADMTLRLLADHPEVQDVITGNADDNRHMRQVNARIGFAAMQVSEERQATVDDVAKLLP
jgi:GNAT superfamily N-acetyltransferase